MCAAGLEVGRGTGGGAGSDEGKSLGGAALVSGNLCGETRVTVRGRGFAWGPA